MSGWLVILIASIVLGILVTVVRKWGAASANNKILQKNIEAARTRKAINNEIQNLNKTELAARLRSGL